MKQGPIFAGFTFELLARMKERAALTRVTEAVQTYMYTYMGTYTYPHIYTCIHTDVVIFMPQEAGMCDFWGVIAWRLIIPQLLDVEVEVLA